MADKIYKIKFDFTTDKQNDLREKIWPESIAKRIIKNELKLYPCVENGHGDVRYETNDAGTMMELMKIAKLHSAGGWWAAEPMKKEGDVFHFSLRGGKYHNCSDYKESTN